MQELIVDLHTHSHYSRATSKNADLKGLYYWAKLKGINIIGTGDFTHPEWFAELREFLEPAEPGLFRLRSDIAEEIDNPRRNLPLSLLAGTTAVVIIYVLVNAVYLRALGLEGLAATRTPASDAAAGLFGGWGDTFVTASIAISTFGFLDLAILAPTRVYYAMAADRVFLPGLAKLHPVYRTPWLAIVIQSTWSCILAATGSYERLLNYVVFADWIFFGLTVGTVLIFRRTHPLSQREAGSYRSPGYPIVQIFFVLIAAAVVLSVVRDDPSSAMRGALLLAAGIPVFWWYQRKG